MFEKDDMIEGSRRGCFRFCVERFVYYFLGEVELSYFFFFLYDWEGDYFLSEGFFI